MKAVLSINGNLVELEGTWEEFISLFMTIGSAQKPAKEPKAKKESYAKYYHEALEMSLKAYVLANKDKPVDEITKQVIDACTAKSFELEEPRVRMAIETCLLALSQ